MRKLVLAAGLALLCSVAQAKTVNWSLTLPTKYDDGHALAQSDLAAVNLYVDGSKTPVAFPVQTSGTLDLKSGDHTLCATVVSKPDSYGEGEESDCSNSIMLAVEAPKPSPPTLLEIIVAFLKRLFAHFV